jgi:DNA modification methylase
VASKEAEMKTEATREAPKPGTLEIVHVPIESVNPAPYNPRQMPPEELEKLKRSIQRFGFVEPLVVQLKGRVVIGGHQRLEAARQLGFTTVPVVLVDVSDEEAKILNLALNKIQGKWDTMRLASLFSELRILPTPELELSGFLRSETTAIIRALDWGRRPSPDDVPEAPESPSAKPGDIWRLGDHLLLCGDCTDPRAVRRLLSGQTVDLVLTDPPFGINYDPGERPGAQTQGRKIAGDNLSGDAYRALLEGSLKIAFDAASPGAPIYMFHASTLADVALAAFKAAGWRLSACLVWTKSVPTFGRGDYHWAHEGLLYGWRPGGRHRWYGGHAETTVWEVGGASPLLSSSNDRHLHPNQKPVALLERAILNSARPGDTVYDPFVGSGSTLIACERQGRRCLAVEVDARFVDVVVRRWEQHTGQKAQLVQEV